jgi:dihydropteroate synthase
MFQQPGSRRFDLSERPVVVGILRRTRNSFFDRGAHFELDPLMARAEQLVADGADVLEVGARPGGVGVADVPPDRERDLAAEFLAELRSRFDVPLGVDTTRATVARAACRRGGPGQRHERVSRSGMSGFSDPGFLPAAAEADRETRNPGS